MSTSIEEVIADWIKSGLSPYGCVDQVKQAARTLRGFGLCGLCVLRFIQLPVGPIYHECGSNDICHAFETEAKSEANKEQDQKVHDDKDGKEAQGSQFCTTCLGILDLDLATSIAEKYKMQAFDSPNVSVGIELPKSIYIRHRSVAIAGKKQEMPLVASSVPEIKDAVRYLIFHRLSVMCGIKADSSSDTRIDVVFSHEETSQEHQLLFPDQGAPAKQPKHRRGKTVAAQPAGKSLSVVLAELGQRSDDWFTENFACPPSAISSQAKIESLTFKRASLFVGGRYLKLERNISQTPFIVEGRRMTETSVAEVIGEPLQRLVCCDEYNLVGSGREDADVRMLGDGRPFYIECMNPRIKAITQEQIHDTEASLVSSNSPVQVRRLQIIRPDDTSIIKEGEENKSKKYCALVWLSTQLTQEKLDEINSLGQNGILLQQKTPVRVLHRRAPLTRPKKLLSLAISHIEGNFYKVRIESEAGAYIKEFVHGDLGRTSPSLTELTGHAADILELDVEGVSLDFPPVPEIPTTQVV